MKKPKTAEQKKADKAFIAKISTIGISTGKSSAPQCPGCGDEMVPVGVLSGTIHGKKIGGAVFGPRPPSSRSDEQSFSA